MNWLRVAAKTNPDERTLIQRMEAALTVLTDRIPGPSFPRPDGPFPAGGPRARTPLCGSDDPQRKRKKKE